MVVEIGNPFVHETTFTGSTTWPDNFFVATTLGRRRGKASCSSSHVASTHAWGDYSRWGMRFVCCSGSPPQPCNSFRWHWARPLTSSSSSRLLPKTTFLLWGSFYQVTVINASVADNLQPVLIGRIPGSIKISADIISFIHENRDQKYNQKFTSNEHTIGTTFSVETSFDAVFKI